jgi:glycerophosphoryl diester phosphodiesterase
MKKAGLFFSIAFALSCERIEYYPDKPLAFERTFIIAHKGGGTFDAGDTREACMHGLSRADGIEVDIQKDDDDNLWLSHDASLPACGVFGESCFGSRRTMSIIQLDTCLGNDINYTQLEWVFEYMSANYPHSFLSLDVKAWRPCELTNINVGHEMNTMAQEIIRLARAYQMEDQVMVESESGDFLYYVKTHSDKIETYLATLGDFELGVSRAIDAGFSGVSFQYKTKEPVTKELVDLLRRKGLKIQLWTIKVAEEMTEALTLQPDFIQTDVL